MICRDCKDTLPDESFAWRKKGVVRHTICRRCQAVRQADWYAKNREKHVANAQRITQEARVRQRALLAEIKSRPCTDCHKRYPSYVMQFDHDGDKAFTIAAKVGVYSDERLLAEVAKCEVVCANCHAERTHARSKAS